MLPDGAEVDGATESVNRFEEFAPHQAYAAGSSHTQQAIRMGLDILTRPDDRTIGYDYREWILREGNRLYVRAGATRDQAGRAWLQKPASGHFIISTRSEAALMRGDRIVLFIALGIGIAAIVGGVALGIADLV